MRRWLSLTAVLTLLAALAVPAGANDTPDRLDRPVTDSIESLKLDSTITIDSNFDLGILDGRLSGATGLQRVVVQLSEDTVTSVASQGKNAQAQKNQLKKVERQQARFARSAAAVGAVELGTAQRALNAVILDVDGARLKEIASMSGVVSVRPVVDYQMALDETVPWIGASAAQLEGYNGAGVSVAVLDSGVDYTHESLGGPGTLKAYELAYGIVPMSGKNRHTTDRYLSRLLYPTDVVVGGWDFVGEAWTGDDNSPPEAADPDPIDIEGHGTHVADIIHAVAPEADIYAVKVCASFDTACSGVALIQAMDFVVDPNGDGDTSDHIDIVNMSLGALYGQPFDDDLSQAVEAASAIGVLTVSAAGNAADKPYIVDTPSGALSSLSVAQTEVPSAVQPLMEVTEPEAIRGLYAAVFQPWSMPLTEEISAPVQYGNGLGGNLNGCAPFDSSLEGFVVLVDRGACNFSLKISNISQAGGEAGIIGLIDGSAPFTGGDGGDRPIDIPGFMISLSDANTLRSGIPETYVNFDPEAGIPLELHMVGSSARGPVIDSNIIKPDIGAPGASVSAIAGTGTGTGPFGGTSGATPMAAGSAALVLGAYPDRSPAEVKAVLMNTAETDIMNAPAFFGGDLAAITRIGGGEVRVDRGISSPAAAWDTEDMTGSLSFRFHDVADAEVVLTRNVTVKNYSDKSIEYGVTPAFRFANDEANAAVAVDAPSSVVIAAGGTRSFDVTMTIDGAALRNWGLNSGSAGADGDLLSVFEYDGYLLLDDAATETSDDLHLAWQVLPRKAAHVVPDATTFAEDLFPAVIGLDNQGVGAAQNDAYSLLATSPDLPEGPIGGQAPTPDLAAVGINTFPVPGGFCSDDESFVWAFAVNTHERQTHAVSPGIYWFDLDTDQDGTPDYAVYNYDLSGLGSISNGQNATWAAPYVEYPNTIGAQSAFFLTEHATNTGNTALFICGEQIGLSGSDILASNVDIVDIFAFDIYFGGPGDQIAGPITVTPLGERYFGLPSDVPGDTYDPSGLLVFDFGPFPGNSDELGVMLFTNGGRGPATGGATEATETLLFLAN